MGFIPENVIVNLKKEIAASGGAAIEALITRVQTLETTVGDETGGLVKDVDDLETVVGDSSSGLVKDVDDLETVVGDSSSGLVKAVNDLNNLMPSAYSSAGLSVTGCVIRTGGFFKYGNICVIACRFLVNADTTGVVIEGFPAYDSTASLYLIYPIITDITGTTSKAATLNYQGAFSANLLTAEHEYCINCVYLCNPPSQLLREADQEENDLK